VKIGAMGFEGQEFEFKNVVIRNMKIGGVVHQTIISI